MTDDRTWFTNDQNLTYRFNNGVPNQLTESISPWVNDARAAWDGTVRPGTVDAPPPHAAGRRSGSIARRSWFPAQQEGPSRFLPAPIVVPGNPRRRQLQGPDAEGRRRVRPVRHRQDGAQDEPRKISGRRRRVGNYANTNPTLRMPQTTSVFGTAGVTRAWTDANGNFVPDCDLLNPAAAGSPAVRRRPVRRRCRTRASARTS